MSNHYIKTIRLDLTANSEKEGFRLQQGFSELVRTKLNQKMEDIFDEFGKDQNIRIENLELEVQGVEAENWEEDFIKKFSQQLIAQLKNWQANSTSSPSSTIPTALSPWKSFLFFLEKGHFPWRSNQLTVNTLDEFIKKETESNQSLILLVNQIKDDPISLQRLIHQLPISTLDFIFDKLSKGEMSFISFYKILEKTFSKRWNRNEVKLGIWSIAFHTLFKNPPERIGIENFKNKLQLEVLTKTVAIFSKKKRNGPIIQKLTEVIFNELKLNFNQSKLKLSDATKSFFQQNKFNNKSFTKKEILQKKKTQSSKTELNNNSIDKIIGEGIFISNAGIVLLNPYLKMFFNRLGLTENNNFKSKTDQNQAALILQYLVTGEFSSMESDLSCNKILCNIPLEQPIPTELTLDENQIELCDGLLKAVIKNWEKLGNTSVEGLRNSFLIRNGKLSKKENNDWQLQVESKSFDILLSSLPWAISIIKLPWMEKMMTVDWQ